MNDTKRQAFDHEKFADACESKHLLDRVVDKWSILVISLLERGPCRFSTLLREIHTISQRMLTLTLRHLERDGLVQRTVYPVIPPRVEYQLTPPGLTLLDAIQPLVQWTLEHRAAISAARAAYDASTGKDSDASSD